MLPNGARRSWVELACGHVRPSSHWLAKVRRSMGGCRSAQAYVIGEGGPMKA
jgi:hypothetical protein